MISIHQMEFAVNTKSKIAQELVGPLVTRDDIAMLLVAYYGAVVLDEIVADDLCRKCSEQCTDSRMDHRRQIYRLLNTLSHITEETLTKLTALAATRKPNAVRKVLRRMLKDGSCAHLVGEHMWTAPEFFSALVKELDHDARSSKDGGDTVARMMRWLDPLDPLRTSQDCGYRKSMPSKIWR